MAGISKDSNGKKRIVYYNAKKKQECIRLGRVPMRTAHTIKIHVENLLAARASNVSVVSETSDWLREIADDLYDKLVQRGLVAPRKIIGTLGEVIPKIIKEQSIGIKPSTRSVYGQAEKSLYRFFGQERRIDTITSADAKEFKLWLAKNGNLKTPGGLVQGTVAKRIQQVYSYFKAMKESGDIPSNPFKGLTERAEVDETRNLYIEEKTILKIMDYAPDAEWRLIIALWRFAGLRAFSEVLTLKWADIDWNQKKMVVHSPKTEHHPGKGVRIIPFFPRIQECLLEAQKEAPAGAIYVVEKHAPLYLRGQKERIYDSRQGNMGTMFRKIMKRAGVAAWKKLIHNLRASFETDLLSKKHGEFTLTTIAKWLGHSVKVMLEHYARFQESDYAQIAAACERVRQENGQTMGDQGVHFDSFISQKQGSNAGNTVSIPDSGASLKASLYTAAGGEIEWNDGEADQAPILLHLPQVPENKAQ